MHCTVGDVLGYLAAGMSDAQLLADFPQLTGDDIRACFAYAAERERRTTTTPAAPTGSVTNVTGPMCYFAANATRKPMNARRAPGSAAPRVEPRSMRAGSLNAPPRITHSASASRPARSSASS